MRAIASSPLRARATLPSSHQPPVRGGGSKGPAAALLRARLLGCSCNSGNSGSVSHFERQGTALENRQYTGVPFRFPRNTSRSFRAIPCSDCGEQRHKIIRNGVVFPAATTQSETGSAGPALGSPALHNKDSPLRIIVLVEQFHAWIGHNNATRLSGKQWLCSATRA